MARACPTCNSSNVATRTKEVEGGTQTFESCRDCPFSTAVGSNAEGYPRDYVKGYSSEKGILKAMRDRRERRLGVTVIPHKEDI